jgi:hypothetical protein
MTVGGTSDPVRNPGQPSPVPGVFPLARLNAVGQAGAGRARLSYVGTGSSRDTRPGHPRALPGAGPSAMPRTRPAPPAPARHAHRSNPQTN